MKTSALEKAIANLKEQRAVLDLAILKLEEQQRNMPKPKSKIVKPRLDNTGAS